MARGPCGMGGMHGVGCAWQGGMCGGGVHDRGIHGGGPAWLGVGE